MCPLPPAHTHMGLWIITCRLLCLRLTCGQPKAGTLQTAGALPGVQTFWICPLHRFERVTTSWIFSLKSGKLPPATVPISHISQVQLRAPGATFCEGCLWRRNSYSTLIVNACLNPWGLYFKKPGYFMVVFTGLQVPLTGFMQKRIRESFSYRGHNWRCWNIIYSWTNAVTWILLSVHKMLMITLYTIKLIKQHDFRHLVK